MISEPLMIFFFFPHDQVIFLILIHPSIFHTPPLKTAQYKQYSHTDLFNKCNVSSVEERLIETQSAAVKILPRDSASSNLTKALIFSDPLINKLMSYYYSAAVGGKTVIHVFRSRPWLWCWLQASIHYFMHHILGGKNYSYGLKIDLLHKEQSQFVHMFACFSHRHKPLVNSG